GRLYRLRVPGDTEKRRLAAAADAASGSAAAASASARRRAAPRGRRVLGRNGMVTEQFLVDPGAGQQFIYTGIRPSDVVLGALIARQMEQQPPPIPPS